MMSDSIEVEEASESHSRLRNASSMISLSHDLSYSQLDDSAEENNLKTPKNGASTLLVSNIDSNSGFTNEQNSDVLKQTQENLMKLAAN